VRDALLPIGMFSRASSLSIKTLRAYHEAGILVPAQVDSYSGYRMYTADQLADAAIVRRLRALDLPLDRVREVVQARDPEFTRQVLLDMPSPRPSESASGTVSRPGTLKMRLLTAPRFLGRSKPLSDQRRATSRKTHQRGGTRGR
jgi:DNA-binding transcriptional MerR regulator